MFSTHFVGLPIDYQNKFFVKTFCGAWRTRTKKFLTYHFVGLATDYHK